MSFADASSRSPAGVEHQTLADPQEERGAEARLDAAQLMAECGLRQVQPVARARETPDVGDCGHQLQMADLEIHPHETSSSSLRRQRVSLMCTRAEAWAAADCGMRNRSVRVAERLKALGTEQRTRDGLTTVPAGNGSVGTRSSGRAPRRRFWTLPTPASRCRGWRRAPGRGTGRCARATCAARPP